MRITNNRLTRSYLTNANKNLEYYNESSQKLTSGRAFTRVSQNVAGGKKAMRVRTQLYQNEQFQRNISAANEELSIAESNLREIGDLLVTVKEQAMRANGIADDEVLNTLASTLRELKGSVIQYSNCNYVDKYVFSGTNNKDMPFKTDADGKLLYNGTAVNDITKGADGVFYDADGNVVEMSGTLYIDIGLGLKNNADGSGVDFNSAYEVTFSGLDCLGFGTSERTYTNHEGQQVTEDFPNNVYEIISEMEKALNAGDVERVSALNDQLDASRNNLLRNVAELGVKTQYLERNLSMLEDENVTLSTIQTNLEGIKDTDEIVRMNEYKYAWMLTLQFGSSVLPQSLMDFLK